MAEAVSCVAHGGVLTITLNRPKANAINVPTSLALYQAFCRLRDTPDLRVGILTRSGRFFSAGRCHRGRGHRRQPWAGRFWRLDRVF